MKTSEVAPGPSPCTLYVGSLVTSQPTLAVGHELCSPRWNFLSAFFQAIFHHNLSEIKIEQATVPLFCWNLVSQLVD